LEEETTTKLATVSPGGGDGDGGGGYRERSIYSQCCAGPTTVPVAY